MKEEEKEKKKMKEGRLKCWEGRGWGHNSFAPGFCRRKLIWTRYTEVYKSK